MIVSDYIPTSRVRRFPFLHTLSNTHCRLFDNDYSDQCEIIPHCGFDLHFSYNEQCWASFHEFISHLYVFGEMSSAHSLIGLFIFLVLNCLSCLYILEINYLSVSLAIIFSHSEGCLFTLLTVSFIVKKLLSLIRSHLFVIFLFPVLWEMSHRGSCCDLYKRVFAYVFL